MSRCTPRRIKVEKSLQDMELGRLIVQVVGDVQMSSRDAPEMLPNYYVQYNTLILRPQNCVR